MIPTVKRMMCDLSLDRDTAKEVRGLMDGSIDPEVNPDRYPATMAWVRSCYHRPPQELIALNAIDEIVPWSCGVEGWLGRRGGVSYLNGGDSYSLTLALVCLPWPIGYRWTVSKWATLAERYPG